MNKVTLKDYKQTLDLIRYALWRSINANESMNTAQQTKALILAQKDYIEALEREMVSVTLNSKYGKVS